MDLVIATSGSSAGKPRLVGLSIDALIASAKATELALDGPGRWILALPTHHIAGAMILLRAAVAETNPQVVDTTDGFDPRALLPAIAGVTQDEMPGYLSLVPTQLVQCLDAGEEVMSALRSLSAILVGGAAISQQPAAARTGCRLEGAHHLRHDGDVGRLRLRRRAHARRDGARGRLGWAHAPGVQRADR